MPPAGAISGSKKTKLAKGRLDTFYHLAKEHGFRSRASFKLIQLNKKYNFLDNANSLVDLCAAPGGWLQVAQKHMPAGSVIIGVDLQDIRPIRDVITFTDDITKPSCIRTIQGHLKNSKVDVVLHDGAPNMGTAWAQDAYSQVDLTLKATKCASLVLKKGGWYITKVFRSEDYNSLLWVFNQLFQKVEATKPMASRNTSAEIYVVCRGFLAPTKLDPRLLDSRFVFKNDDPKAQVSLNSITKGKKNRKGYDTDSVLLFKKSPITTFINSEEPVKTLAEHNAFEFDADSEKFANHPKTTLLVKQAFQDLKLLNKNELKNLLKWRSTMRAEVLGKDDKHEKEKEVKEKGEVDAINRQQIVLTKREKRERKKELARKRKQVKKLQLKMALPGDKFTEGDEMFNAETLKDVTDKDLEAIADAKLTEELEMSDEDLPDEIDWSDDSDGDSDDEPTVDKMERDMDLNYRLYLAEHAKRRIPSLVEKSKLDRAEVRSEHHYEEGDSDQDILADDEDDNALLAKSKKNPLLLEEVVPKKRKVDMWFSQGIFEGEDFDDSVEEPKAPKRKLEVENEANKKAKVAETTPKGVLPNGEKANGKQADGKPSGKEAKKETKANGKETKANGKEAKVSDKKAKKEPSKKKEADFEVAPEEPEFNSDDDHWENNVAMRDGIVAEEDSMDEKDQETDDEDDINYKVETLAIATAMLRKKKRLQVEEDMFNRYTFNDDNLPEWFTENEARYIQPNKPVTKADIEEMKQRYREINARPIKKVAEALARKKRRTSIQTTKAKERANVIAQDSSLTQGQKIAQVNRIMKKANQKQGKEKVYVVSKRGQGGSSGKKRKHVSHARVRLVDKRMKKEARAHVRMEKDGRGTARKGGKKPQKGGKKKSR